jgi:peptide/nickel transport system permease protein
MIKYIIKRILMMLPVVLGVVVIVFTIMFLTPGDPAKLILGENARPEDVALLREKLGLNQPYLVQLINYIKGIFLQGNLGNSYVTGRSVTFEILSRFPTTCLLAALSVAISTIIGIFAGIISATRQYSLFDNAATVTALLGVSMPNFWQGLMSLLVFSVWLGWLPPSGFTTPLHWILPSITVGTASAAIIMRMTRSSMLEVIRQDYITMARAKGLSEFVVIVRHALKNALIPIITIIGIEFGSQLGGSLIAETIYAIPGIGKYMVDAIKQRDYPVVQGGVLFTAAIFSFANLAVDIVYTYIDPRLRSQYKKKKERALL